MLTLFDVQRGTATTIESSAARHAAAGPAIVALLEQARSRIAALEAAFVRRAGADGVVPAELPELAHIVARLGKIGQRLGREATRMRHVAHHDWLTGLPNRSLLVDRLDRALAQAARNDRQVGVVMLDLDDFKRVNDELGHVVGDRLLKEVAARLMASTRGADTVCRYGGDEFVVLLPDVAGRHGASEVARKIDAALARAWDVDGGTIVITACLGLSVYPMDGATPADLLAGADAAMYMAKDRSRRAASAGVSQRETPTRLVSDPRGAAAHSPIGAGLAVRPRLDAPD
jgi:diguanylate cyclase (GGDEF)-like protein